jgi:putative endopeptidase
MKRVKTRIYLFIVVGLCWVLVIAQHPTKENHGIDVSYMDMTIKPCADFFHYANGSWIKQAQIPEDYSIWGMVWEVRERNKKILSNILEDVTKRSDWPEGSIQQKISDFCASGMDEAAIEKAGLSPLASDFERIKSMQTKEDLAAEVGRLHSESIFPCFNFFLAIDDKQASSYICQIWQGGLGLSRDDYIKEDDHTRALRTAYRLHVTRMFELLGEEPQTAIKNAEIIMTMETRLAKVSMTNVEMLDPNALYNKMSREQLLNEAPGFDWKTYFDAVGLPATEKYLLVQNLTFLRELGVMSKSLPLAQWQVYLCWHFINNLAPYLNSALVNQDFQFFHKTLNGTQQISPRWKRIQQSLREAMGMAVGRMYVEKVFSPVAKQKALELVKNIRAALRDRIVQLEWMTAPTKQHALKKLDAIVAKIGYPDKWQDYSKLEVDRGPYVLNVRRARAFDFKQNMDLLGKPVDRTKWWMTPETLNARYSQSLNSICFPAGILQPPFFNVEADDACNYGAIGTIIGHEITHGFDDTGRLYDAEGNLRDWWTPEDAKAYEARTEPFIKQYEAYKPLPDMAINGKLTLGENIADLGGLKIAFLAFQKSLEGKPRPTAIDGFSPEQRFFISFAQLYRRIYRPERLRRLLESDYHSPGQFRVNGPLANFPEFYKYFGCTEKDPLWNTMNRRPEIW